jgi:hypothetical protein
VHSLKAVAVLGYLTLLLGGFRAVERAAQSEPRQYDRAV